MGTLTLITVGFLLATAAVMALARASTARWERDKRASVAVGADAPARGRSAGASALGRRLAIPRAGLAALRHHIARVLPGTVLARVLPTGEQQRVRPIRRLVGALRSSLPGGELWRGWRTRSRSPARPVDGNRAAMAPAPEPSRAATEGRAHGVVMAAGQQLFRRAVPRRRRRALAFLHRDRQARDPQVPHGEGGESPAAR